MGPQRWGPPVMGAPETGPPGCRPREKPPKPRAAAGGQFIVPHLRAKSRFLGVLGECWG